MAKITNILAGTRPRTQVQGTSRTHCGRWLDVSCSVGCMLKVLANVNIINCYFDLWGQRQTSITLARVTVVTTAHDLHLDGILFSSTEFWQLWQTRKNFLKSHDTYLTLTFWCWCGYHRHSVEYYHSSSIYDRIAIYSFPREHGFRITSVTTDLSFSWSNTPSAENSDLGTTESSCSPR